MNPTNISIAEGGRKQNNPLSSPSTIGVNQDKVDQPAEDFKYVAEDNRGTADLFTALYNRGNVNNNGTTYEMA